MRGHQGRPDKNRSSVSTAGSPVFFEPLGTPITAGRASRERDSPAVTPDPKPKPDPADKAKGPRDVIIHESMAKRFFPRHAPLTAHLSPLDNYMMHESNDSLGSDKAEQSSRIHSPSGTETYTPT